MVETGYRLNRVARTNKRHGQAEAWYNVSQELDSCKAMVAQLDSIGTLSCRMPPRVEDSSQVITTATKALTLPPLRLAGPVSSHQACSHRSQKHGRCAVLLKCHGPKSGSHQLRRMKAPSTPPAVCTSSAETFQRCPRVPAVLGGE